MGLQIRRIFLTLAAVVTLLLLSGITYERWSRWEVAQNNPPPGRLIEVDGLKMHLSCLGTGSPTVVLESGSNWYGALSWVLVQPEIARSNRVCSYDRAGIMWSEAYADTPTATQYADSLRKLLETSPEPAPYIMVGHSMGALIISIFADRFPEKVGGLVYVDPTPPDIDERYVATFDESYWEDYGWTYLYLRAAAETGLMRLFDLPSGWLTTDGVPTDAQLAHNFAPQSSKAVIRELVGLPALSAKARRLTSLGDRPVIVLSAGVWTGSAAGAARDGEDSDDKSPSFGQFLLELHEEAAGLSTNGQHRIAEKSGHGIPFQNPGSVIEAIRDVATAVTKSQQVEESPDM